MQFQQTLLALVATLMMAPALHAANVPDGGYMGVTLEDGSSVFTSLTDKAMEPIKVPVERLETLTARAAQLAKRRTDCWGYELDHAGVDSAINALRDWAGTYGHDLSSGNSPNWVGFTSNNVLVYYCITTPHRTGNIDRNDVNYAVGSMDAKCRPYEASWFVSSLGAFKSMFTDIWPDLAGTTLSNLSERLALVKPSVRDRSDWSSGHGSYVWEHTVATLASGGKKLLDTHSNTVNDFSA